MVGDLLTEVGVPTAVMDLDWLRRSWPGQHRFCVGVASRNLRSGARSHRDTGASQDSSGRRHRDQGRPRPPRGRARCSPFGGRLRVDLQLVWASLAQRHEGDGLAPQWSLAPVLGAGQHPGAAAIEDFTFGAKSSVAVRWPTG